MDISFVLLLTTAILLVSYLIQTQSRKSDPNKAGSEFKEIMRKVYSEENADKIYTAMKFHTYRVGNGADWRDSYDRLLSDLREIGGLEKE